MKSTFRILFYVRKDKLKNDGSYPIFCRVTVDGEQSRFNTKAYIHLENWDVNVGKAVGKSAEAQNVNSLLNEVSASLHRIYHEQQRKSQATAETIKNEFLGLNECKVMLLDLFDKCNDNIKEQIGKTKSKATYQKYCVTRRHVAEFMKYKYNISDINMKSIDYTFISDFDIYLKTICNCGHNTTMKFLEFFKRVVIYAGIIVIDPFANYKLTKKPVDRGYLTDEELNKIIKKKFASNRLEQVKDVFIFACFTGLVYIDVKNLNKDNIRKSFDGSIWIMTKRHKTDISVNVPLLKIPSMILEKYKGKLKKGQILPVLSNQKTNSYLKEIADICGINKNLTFHLARHTFATTTTLAKGVPIETVSKMLGHTNISTTQIYARITNTKISEDMRVLAKKNERY